MFIELVDKIKKNVLTQRCDKLINDFTSPQQHGDVLHRKWRFEVRITTCKQGVDKAHWTEITVS